MGPFTRMTLVTYQQVSPPLSRKAHIVITAGDQPYEFIVTINVTKRLQQMPRAFVAGPSLGDKGRLSSHIKEFLFAMGIFSPVQDNNQ